MLSTKIILIFLVINTFTQTLCKKKYVIGSSKSDNFKYQYVANNDAKINNFNATEKPSNQNVNSNYQNVLNNNYQFTSTDNKNNNNRHTHPDSKSTYEHSTYNPVENEINQNYNKGYFNNYTTTNQHLNVRPVIVNSSDNTTNNNTYNNLYNNFVSNLNTGYYNVPNNSVIHGFYDSYSTLKPYETEEHFSKANNTIISNTNTNPNADYNNNTNVYNKNEKESINNTNTYNPNDNNLVDNYNTTRSKRRKKKREPIPLIQTGCILFCQNSKCAVGYKKQGGYCIPDKDNDYEYY